VGIKKWVTTVRNMTFLLILDEEEEIYEDHQELVVIPP
jgi:hypothetical protein